MEPSRAGATDGCEIEMVQSEDSKAKYEGGFTVKSVPTASIGEGGGATGGTTQGISMVQPGHQVQMQTMVTNHANADSEDRNAAPIVLQMPNANGDPDHLARQPADMITTSTTSLLAVHITASGVYVGAISAIHGKLGCNRLWIPSAYLVALQGSVFLLAWCSFKEYLTSNTKKVKFYVAVGIYLVVTAAILVFFSYVLFCT